MTNTAPNEAWHETKKETLGFAKRYWVGLLLIVAVRLYLFMSTPETIRHEMFANLDNEKDIRQVMWKSCQRDKSICWPGQFYVDHFLNKEFGKSCLKSGAAEDCFVSAEKALFNTVYSSIDKCRSRVYFWELTDLETQRCLLAVSSSLHSLFDKDDTRGKEWRYEYRNSMKLADERGVQIDYEMIKKCELCNPSDEARIIDEALRALEHNQRRCEYEHGNLAKIKEFFNNVNATIGASAYRRYKKDFHGGACEESSNPDDFITDKCRTAQHYGQEALVESEAREGNTIIRVVAAAFALMALLSNHQIQIQAKRIPGRRKILQSMLSDPVLRLDMEATLRQRGKTESEIDLEMAALEQTSQYDPKKEDELVKKAWNKLATRHLGQGVRTIVACQGLIMILFGCTGGVHVAAVLDAVLLLGVALGIHRRYWYHLHRLTKSSESTTLLKSHETVVAEAER